ncbi:MAG: lysine transporter LysE [Pedosphaera sp.]|nr:lysine transporter LysE [Pedosphaera sp.]
MNQVLITPIFLLAAVAVTLAPGPDILFVIAKGVSQGRTTAIVAATGFVCGLSIHTALAVTGLSALILASAVAFTVVKIAGGAYLVYLGIRAWCSRGLISLPAPGTNHSPRRIFTQAFCMNVLNPKVAIFFLAFLPQFTHPDRGHLPAQFLILGLCFALQTWVIFSLVGAFSSVLGRSINRRPQLARTLDLLAGSIFVALGIRLAFTRN